MKRLVTIIILLMMSQTLLAQNPTTVTGTITDPSGVPYFPATVTACLTPVTTDPIVNGVHVNQTPGGNYCAPLANTSATGAFSLGLFPNSAITPSGTQWRFTVTALGTAPPAGKGSQTFQSTITISGTSQDIGATLTGASLALLNGSVLSGTTPPTCTTSVFQYFNTTTNQLLLCNGNSLLTTAAGSPATAMDAALFGVTANTQYVLDATWTISTQNISSATGAFKLSDNTTPPKACVGISNSGTATLPVGTLTVLTSTTATCSVNATASQTNGTFVWGTDDTTAMQNAWNAILTRPALGAAPTASCGGEFLLPYGLIWLTKNPATTATLASCGQFDTMFPQYFIEGVGPGATVFFLAPSFAFDSTLAGGCRFGSLASTCLWGTNYTHLRGFGATTLGFIPTLNGPASVLTLGVDSVAEKINVFNIPGNVGNLTGISILGQGDACVDCNVDNAAGTGFKVSAQGATCITCFTGTGLVVIGGSFNDYGGFYNGQANLQDAVAVSASGIMNMFGTMANSINSTFPACSVALSSVLNIYGTNQPTAGLAACSNAGTGAGIYFRGNNATVSLSSALVKGGATLGAINSSTVTGAKVIDLGNNTITGTMANFTASAGTWLGYGNGPNVRGFCTGIATAASTLGLRISGSSTAAAGVASTCTSTTIDAGQVMQTAGTLIELLVNAGTGGVNASSGVVTVLKNGVAQTMTCTLGTATSCQNGTNTVAYAIGDLISIQFTTQAAETLANVKATVIAN